MSYLIYKQYCEGRGWAMICVESKKLGFWWAGSHPVHHPPLYFKIDCPQSSLVVKRPCYVFSIVVSSRDEKWIK